MEETDDLLRVDPELLNLPEHLFTTHPQLLQHLFSSWISLPLHSKLVKDLIPYIENGNLISTIISSRSVDAGAAVENNSLFNAIYHAVYKCSASASTSETNLAVEHNTLPSSSSTPLALAGEIENEVIPQFYFPSGQTPIDESREDCLKRIDKLFGAKINGLNRTEFKEVTKEVCSLPFFLSSALFDKIATDGSFEVTRDAFIQYWVNRNMHTKSMATQIYDILKQPDRSYLTQADILTALQELCDLHPGLADIKEDPDARESYASTVLFRIFYHINRAGNDRITRGELERGDLVAAMKHADEEADINKVQRYFSYHHAEVIHWKFMYMDTDGDLHIDRTDLANYNNNALTNRILDRIFAQIPRKFKSKIEGKMCYEDFVYFVQAEEDKQSESSLAYWFRCIDLDGNGILTCDELKHFYEEQIKRMEVRMPEEEVVPFERMVDRCFDMIEPEVQGRIGWRDVRKNKLSGDFFNILFNLDKDLANMAAKRLPEDRPTEWEQFIERETRILMF